MCVYYDVSNSFFVFMFLHRSKKLRNLLLLPFFKWNCSKESHNCLCKFLILQKLRLTFPSSKLHPPGIVNFLHVLCWHEIYASLKMRVYIFSNYKFGLSSSLYLLFPHDGMELNNFTLKMKKYAKSYLGQNFWKARSSLSSIQ